MSSDLVSEAWEEIQRARARLAGEPSVLLTPLLESAPIADACVALWPAGTARPRVFLKLESEQTTGSFKLRGATNKVKALIERRAARGGGSGGFITASSGNHGRACAHALAATGAMEKGLDCRIVLPENVNPLKLAALKRFGIPLTLFGPSVDHAELHAKEMAESQGCAFVSPYNDLEIIGGQGTAGLELIEQARSASHGRAPDHVVVPVGGGGLVSGVAVAVSRLASKCAIIGAAPTVNACMADSLAAGRLLGDDEFDGSAETLSDGTAGGIEPGSITFPICQAVCHQHVGVSEANIAAGVRLVRHSGHNFERLVGSFVRSLVLYPATATLRPLPPLLMLVG